MGEEPTKSEEPTQEEPAKTQIHDITEFTSTLALTETKLAVYQTKWDAIFANESENIPEVIKGEISAVLGKITLLTTSKFKQYRRLLHACQYGEADKSSGKETLPGDLHGYWTIVEMQLDQIDDD